MIWELAVSCGLVLVGHARTLYRVHRVNTARDTYESTLAINIASYTGPLADTKADTHTYRKTGTCRCESCTRNAAAAELNARTNWEDPYPPEPPFEHSATAAYLRGDLKLPPGVTPPGVGRPPFTRKELEEMSHEDLIKYGLISTNDQRYRTIIVPPDAMRVTFHEDPTAKAKQVAARIKSITDNPQGLYEDAMHAMLTSHTCRGCGMISYNENDVRHSYCGRCHHFCKDSGEEYE